MATTDTLTWDQVTHVNHDSAWQVLQRTDREGLLVMLARALRSVPPSNLESIFGDHAHPHEIGGAHGQQTPKPLLESITEFTEAALRGEFYEDFMVNSRNCTEKSGKTQVFEAQLELLFDRCVAEVPAGDPSEICSSYELLFDLLREIDKFEKDIVFFADEGGIWQFGVNWQRVLPGYIRCLAKTTDADEFERRAQAVLEDFVDDWHQGELKKLVASEAARMTRRL